MKFLVLFYGFLSHSAVSHSRWEPVFRNLFSSTDCCKKNTMTTSPLVQLSSVAQSCPAPRDPMDCSTPGFPVPHQLRELTQTHVHRVGDAIQTFHPLSSPSPPAFNLSIRVFSNESVLCLRWPKYWSFSFSTSSSSEYSGLISLTIDWFDDLAVQGTLKSLLQHHSSKASILLCSAFFIVQTLTSINDYWKNHSLD